MDAGLGVGRIGIGEGELPSTGNSHDIANFLGFEDEKLLVDYIPQNNADDQHQHD